MTNKRRAGIRLSREDYRSFCARLLTVAGVLVVASENVESQSSSPEATPGFAIVNVNVVPMDHERILEKHTVVIRDGVITRLGPASSIELEAGLHAIDGTGKYLLPGLVDSHVHLEGGDDLVLYVANGVTAVRNLWGLPQHLQLRQRIAEDPTFVAPAIYTAGPIIDGSPPRWPGSVTVTSAEQARSTVDLQARAGFDFIKVYNQLSLEAYETLIATAADRELTVQGHIPYDVGLFRALALGQHAIDHFDGYRQQILNQSTFANVPLDQVATRLDKGQLAWDEVFDPEMMERAVQATIASGTWNIPTVVIRELVAPDEYSTRIRDPGTQYFSQAELDSWKPNAGNNSDRMRAERRIQREFSHRLIAALHKSGGKLLVGTDAPDPFVLPGFSIHAEMDHFVRSGLTPYETLERATRIPAEFMGVGAEVGTIATQMRADLILVDGNPLDDLVHLRQLAGVSLRGRWLPAAELTELLKTIETRARDSVTPRVETAVAPSMLETYVGQYELAPGRLFAVTLENGSLFAQMTGRRKTRIFAMSENTFFSKHAAGRLSLPTDALVEFTSDETGTPSGIILRQRGMEIAGRKIRGVERDDQNDDR